jgi:hypothetical protein
LLRRQKAVSMRSGHVAETINIAGKLHRSRWRYPGQKKEFGRVHSGRKNSV